MRVAVVGAGPKGLYAVEELLARAPRAVVDVWDSRPPGTGAAYATDQPVWLRLNVTSAIVDGFDAWRLARGEAAPLDPFPPRALLGVYLAERWASLFERHAGLSHVARAAGTVEASGAAWAVDGAAYDEVLLATGHATDSPDGLAAGWSGPQALVPSVYPVSGLDAVPAGAVVASRGAALTFIDLALALTEGRGGRFTGEPWAPGYMASGDEPGSLRPVARRGRFMAVKPQPGSAIASAVSGAVRERGLAAIRAAGDASVALAVVPATARNLLAGLGQDPAGVEDVFEGAPTHADAVDALRASLAVATDRARPDAGWAVGAAWRELYPALVERFSLGGGLAFEPFAEAASRLEGVAFGPPPVNAAKLLALVEAGVVDASSLATDTIDGSGHHGPVAVDVVVDAVLPGPGVVTGAVTLPGRLVEAGLLVQAPGRRGVAHTADATCLSPDGHPLPGLAVVGRPTEDATVGNDTLSRSLHPARDAWALRVAARFEEER
ncbi:FAD/NAD(P)-binding protein [Propioniciclava sp. MC1595]|uniref:FAD/NAD(P)-binding protein n=1 Tax=Propioniciclava sp. MC1595 TaxID=2760308 RepID=UPI0016623A32|nr:FAD/NAD(P)-binding protein [Propioniciclava sp. MC1595]MBB1493605.1 FAD/NAD(P)-binding protein [Propioniciclava sp. MC1595]QTE26995.1 FAD/NAD(P)-binding protein [Propioniciclava sp. MC1595]